MPTEQSPPRRRGEAVRRAVLDATAAELTTAGVDHVTIAAVAARAGVHETSIYRRWVTKEALLLETAQEQTADGVPEPDTGSLHGDLAALAQSLDAFLRSPIGGALLRIALTAATADGATARAKFWLHRLGDNSVMLERAASRDEIRPSTNPELLMQALVGSVHLGVIFGGPPLDDGRAKELADLLLTGASFASSC
ncbi:TetR family transcriptional regulator [Microbacterium sp. Gd 4-13]|uniref:TetR/AcrR family transcriptional regulator n=1 Tax=Microbacterium sp. Gd 4-13 TaxID=2173179 RepID=UPI000D5738FF|nr:TetR/AcrR family transcriptional regulator [Microbacterium sp. Gd 4-13]PVW06625.1 TetR family transcriptional regulator [Microbacterium sp. Gd 4-13]